tara:strand:+ start:26 stop:466 length:441 start_codon:yes stop_codon:yes gene_type:complete
MKKLLGISVLSLLLSGCGTGTYHANVPAFQHYTNCSNQYEDIRKIAQCGKQSRNSYLYQSGYPASSEGNMYVVFMDSLAGQVDEGKLSNNEARMVWIQRTQELVDGYRQAAAQAATAGALQQQNTQRQIQKGMDMVTGQCTLGVNC